jgi:two-component system response regulator NreC
MTAGERGRAQRALWDKHRPEMLARVTVIEGAILALGHSGLDRRLRSEAQQSAHTLCGSLGVFGFADASQAAHELELELAAATQERAPALSALAAVIRRGLEAKGKIRIVLADDHEIVRSGLRLLLDSAPDLEVVAEAADVESTQRYVRGHHPAVLVLDLNMPGSPSAETIPKMREEFPATQIVVLTAHREPALARQALDAGAVGYVLKDADQRELLEAVRLAATGRRFLDPRLGPLFATEPSSTSPGALSKRELGVLRLIALGHTNAEIGEQLHLSVRTVESHRAHIQRKLQLSSRAELVRYALDRGLIET